MRLAHRLFTFVSFFFFASAANADIVPPWFKAEQIRFEFVDCGRVHITNAVAYVHHGETVIRGDATLYTRERTAAFSNLVSAKVVRPDGTKAQLAPVAIHARPRPRVFDRSGYFTFHVGYRLPAGTVARLICE
jgi:hypothetical protein